MLYLPHAGSASAQASPECPHRAEGHCSCNNQKFKPQIIRGCGEDNCMAPPACRQVEPWARMFKLLRSPKIDSKEPMLPGYTAWRAGATTQAISTRSSTDSILWA